MDRNDGHHYDFGKVTNVPLPNIREWLRDQATRDFFTFDKDDFEQDCEEILRDYAEAEDSAKENETRLELWNLLSVWQRDKEYLSSLNLHRVIAKHVRMSCRLASVDETLETWAQSEVTRLDTLADEVAREIRDTLKVRAPSRKHTESKFSAELVLDPLEKFHLGLEKMIGYPASNEKILDLMKQEHERGGTFVGPRGRTVDPKVEWNVVIHGARCESLHDIKKRKCSEPLEFYTKLSKTVFEKAHASCTINDAEVAALRLWTGPMHEKYSELLRKAQEPSGNGPSAYVNTLHAINSGITKLARIWRLPANRKVYRGYRGLIMQKLKKDAFQCVGGVEKSVLATSEEFDVAVSYSGDGAFILEIDVGQVNRGADVSWLSQFPHEKEILFNALSNVEFVCSPQRRFVEGRGTILVYQVCVSANVKSKTLDEFDVLRKELHLNSVDLLTQEALLAIQQRRAGSEHGLIELLLQECKNQGEHIRSEADKADVGMFNKGTPEYVKLVEAAGMFQPRSLEIIGLALGWLSTKQADPAELDRLQDWQIQALKAALKKCQLPCVGTTFDDPARQLDNVFSTKVLDVGNVQKLERALRLAKLLSLNPNLTDLRMNAATAKADFWEKMLIELCPERANLSVNGFHPAQYAITTLQLLEIRKASPEVAAITPPALQFHVPTALTSLSLWGSPIACAGAESLGRAFSGLHSLKYLNLRQCSIADSGCTGISHTLSALSKLERLDLSQNMVTDDGFKKLASAVDQSTRLQSVDMRFNKTRLPSQGKMMNNIVTRFSHSASISCVAWSPKGDKKAFGTRDDQLLIWDADAKGECQVSRFNGHSGTVISVAWSAKGDQIASGSDDNSIIIWNTMTGARVRTLNGHSNWVQCVAWRPDDIQIASGSYDNSIIIWNIEDGTPVSILRGNLSVTSISWSPNCRQIVSGCGNPYVSGDQNEIVVWDASTGDKVLMQNGHSAAVIGVSWSPKGDRIASGSWDKTIIIWDATSGSQVSTLSGHNACVNSVMWSPNGERIVSGSDDKKIIIWEAKTGKKISILEGHTASVLSVAWSPRGDHVVSGARDEAVIVWDANPSDEVSALDGHSAEVTSVAWNSNSKLIASGSIDNKIILWNATTLDQVLTLHEHISPVTCVEFSPNGDKIASGSDDKTIIIWDTKTGKKVSTLECKAAPVLSVSWSHDGSKLVSGGCGLGNTAELLSNPGEIIIWDVAAEVQLSAMKAHIAAVRSVAWSPVDERIASGSSDKTIIIWNAKTADQPSFLKGHSAPVNCVKWSPDGVFVVGGSDDKTIIIWNAMTKMQIRLEGHSDCVKSLDWSPNGHHIASGASDNAIIVWDAMQGQQVSILKGHTSKINSVVWSGCWQLVSSASEDNTVMIWDVGTEALASRVRLLGAPQAS